MLSPEKNQQLCELLWALRDGTMTPEQVARLDEMVCQDGDARSTYVRYVDLFAGLHWYGVSYDGDEVAPRAPEITGRTASAPDDKETPRRGRNGRAPTLPLPSQSARPPISGLPADVFRPLDQSSSRTVRLSLLVAAAFMGAVLTLLGFWAAPSYRRWADDKRPHPLEPLAGVARITDAVECTWAGSSAVPQTGDPLGPGRRLDLVRGLAEITFHTGAKVILHGPTAFDIESSDGGFLREGRLTAKVPPDVRGFAIRTAELEVVDLGTEFGLHVDGEGIVDVHVFQGNVEVRGKNSYGRVWTRKGRSSTGTAR